MIETWKMTAVESAASWIGWGGLLIGIVFGFLVARTNFCTMGSLSDILSFGSYNRFRSWLLAAATAMLGVWVIQGAGMVDTSMSMYRTGDFGWGGNIIGGLAFGFGMVFAGGCASRNLVRAGGGDLRSVVVLIVMGIFAYMTIGGLLGPLRVSIFTPLTANVGDDQSLGVLIADLFGMSAQTASTLVMAIIVLSVVIYCFKDAAFRRSTADIVGGVGIGLCVVAGWAVTGLAFDEFEANAAVLSLSYVRPSGDTLDYLMRYTALGAPDFGVASFAGALVGGFLGAAYGKRLHLTTFAGPSDAVRNMFGAALMGIGGVLALGCTVGQALTGVSTVAIGSFLTFAFIVVGGIAGIKTMENMA
jgi:uncharacterized protein